MNDKLENKSPDENINYNRRFKTNLWQQKAALKKAWEVRNYEIDKFWQRSIFFWGFIFVLFAGYGFLITSDYFALAQKMYFDLYIILLGIIFSVAWFLVAKASKYYQENWEAHIERLEYEIMGPLYKTVLRQKSHSISNILIAITVVVIAIWFFLLLRYFFEKCGWQNICMYYLEKYLFVCIPIFLTVICILYFIFCCKTGGNKCCFKTNKKGFYDRIKGSEYEEYYDNDGKYVGEK